MRSFQPGKVQVFCVAICGICNCAMHTYCLCIFCFHVQICMLSFESICGLTELPYGTLKFRFLYMTGVLDVLSPCGIITLRGTIFEVTTFKFSLTFQPASPKLHSIVCEVYTYMHIYTTFLTFVRIKILWQPLDYQS